MKLQFTLALTVLVSLYSATSLAAGDAAKGKVLYGVCAACHGANGEGQEALNAPKLQGQQEWYVIRQLQNFKGGIRGTNPKDTYGMQMAPMSQTLTNDQAIADVAAFIKSLK